MPKRSLGSLKVHPERQSVGDFPAVLMWGPQRPIGPHAGLPSRKIPSFKTPHGAPDVKRIKLKNSASVLFGVFDFDFQPREPVWFLTFWREGRPVVPPDGPLRGALEGRRQKDKNQALGRRFLLVTFLLAAPTRHFCLAPSDEQKKSHPGPGRSAWDFRELPYFPTARRTAAIIISWSAGAR